MSFIMMSFFKHILRRASKIHNFEVDYGSLWDISYVINDKTSFVKDWKEMREIQLANGMIKDESISEAIVVRGLSYESLEISKILNFYSKQIGVDSRNYFRTDDSEIGIEISEAIYNAVDHSQGDINIRFLGGQSKFLVIISDKGSGFDVKSYFNSLNDKIVKMSEIDSNSAYLRGTGLINFNRSKCASVGFEKDSTSFSTIILYG